MDQLMSGCSGPIGRYPGIFDGVCSLGLTSYISVPCALDHLTCVRTSLYIRPQDHLTKLYNHNVQKTKIRPDVHSKGK